MKLLVPALCAGMFLLTPQAAWSGEGIDSRHGDAIQRTMNDHIQELTQRNGNGLFPMFDPESRSLVQLKFTRLHDSVEIRGRKTPYFVSCADFVAEDGTPYDIDFFVSTSYGVVSSLVHSKGGSKSPYDIH